MILIDTDVAIHWRDGSPDVRDRLFALPALPVISAISRVELENGVVREPVQRERRRRRLDAILAQIRVLDFDNAIAARFGMIVAEAGYSRSRTLDRMIAATALTHGARLVTMNGADYRDIPELDLEVWPVPARPFV